MIRSEPPRTVRTEVRAPTLGPEGGIRLGTLVTIRWLAVLGQGSAILLVAYGLNLTINLSWTLGVVALSALLNVTLQLRLPGNTRLSEKAAWFSLAFDLAHLACLLALTGGLSNPFSVLMFAPTTVCASLLSRRATYALAALALALIILIAQFSGPLPWSGTPPEIPPLLLAGIIVSQGFTLVFLALYLSRMGHEGRAREHALAATQVALEREQRLAALGAQAAAAAHELGTPLGTIMLASKEALRQSDLSEEVREDLDLIYSEVRRCQQTLRTLSIEGGGEDPFPVQTAEAILREAAGPHEDRGIALTFLVASGLQPKMKRKAELIHGLRNIIENAVDHAKDSVVLDVSWSPSILTILISDDGAGFDPAVIRKLGEPYITKKSKQQTSGGLGLGLFIASTLLERTGARLTFQNGADGGAQVCVTWLLDQATEPQPKPA